MREEGYDPERTLLETLKDEFPAGYRLVMDLMEGMRCDVCGAPKMCPRSLIRVPGDDR